MVTRDSLRCSRQSRGVPKICTVECCNPLREVDGTAVERALPEHAQGIWTRSSFTAETEVPSAVDPAQQRIGGANPHPQRALRLFHFQETTFATQSTAPTR